MNQVNWLTLNDSCEVSIAAENTDFSYIARRTIVLKTSKPNIIVDVAYLQN